MGPSAYTLGIEPCSIWLHLIRLEPLAGLQAFRFCNRMESGVLPTIGCLSSRVAKNKRANSAGECLPSEHVGQCLVLCLAVASRTSRRSNCAGRSG